jgi:Mrp family chromosome partitioning ATPase
MSTVLAELHERYDLVVLDSSPVTIVPDSIAVLAQVSGVLVVLRESKSTSVGARRLRDQLAHLGITPLGLVMNGTARVGDAAHYGYYAYTPPIANGSGPASGDGARSSRRGRSKAADGAAKKPA